MPGYLIPSWARGTTVWGPRVVKELWIETLPAAQAPDLIPGFLKRHGAHLISGEHEVGKTLVALEVAHAVLTGEALWGKVFVQACVERVVFILGEHDEEGLQEQWRLTGLSVPPQTLRIIPPSERKILVRKGEIDPVGKRMYMEATQGAGLIVFDPLSAFVAGEDAENDSTTMRHLINGMLDVAKAQAASLLLLHHMGKPAFDPRTGRYAHPQRYASRGSSAIEDAVPVCFYLTRREQGEYHLARVKFKGQAPTHYLLKREGLRHTLLKRGLTQAELASKVAENLPKGSTSEE